MKSSESVVKICLVASSVLGGLIDLLVWKHRKFAMAIFYYECIVLLIHGFVPYDYGAIGDFFIILTMYTIFMGYACDLGRNIIAIVCTYLVLTLFIMTHINNEESISLSKAFGRLYDGVMVFVICTILTLMI